MEKEILKRGYVTHALTNVKGEILNEGSINFEINAVEGPYYWSEVYCELDPICSMFMIVRKGQLLAGATPEELSNYMEQTKVNTRYNY